MGLQLLGKVGAQILAAGAEAVARLGRRGELVVAQNGAPYLEAVRQGNVYAAATPVAGVDHGTAVDTTAMLSLYNPQGSGKLLVIRSGSLAYLSGTLGAGVVWWCANLSPTVTAPSGGTAITPVNLLVGSSNQPVAQAKAGPTVVLPSLLRPLGSMGAMAAASALGPSNLLDEVGGSIVIKPGCALVIDATAAAGTTPRVLVSVEWEEVDE